MILIWLIQVFGMILCDFASPQLFFALLAVTVLLRIFMNFSEKNTLIKVFIITGDIFQIYWEYLIFLICLLVTFPRGTASDTIEGTEYYYESDVILFFVIVMPICFLLAFLPYKISRRLYNKCYSYRKMSENWIFPSRLISIITVTLYFAFIIYYLIESTGIFLAMTFFTNSVILILITRRFFRNKKSGGNYTEYTSIMKVLSVVINIASGVIAFIGVRLGSFITGEVAVFFPYVINFLLYRRLYKKNGLSEWWTFPAIIISIGAFLIYWYGLTEVFI